MQVINHDFRKSAIAVEECVMKQISYSLKEVFFNIKGVFMSRIMEKIVENIGIFYDK